MHTFAHTHDFSLKILGVIAAKFQTALQTTIYSPTSKACKCPR